MTKSLTAISTMAFGAVLMASTAIAAPIVLEGNYVRVGVNDYGTLGSGGSTSPGILHDPTGTQNFAPGGIQNDYLTPGTPHEGWLFKIGSSTFVSGNNSGGVSGIGTSAPVAGTVAGYDNSASWTNSNTFMTVKHEYFFNDGDERVNIRTTLTALGALNGVKFLRSEDPDPDINSGGSFDTNNQRGNSVFDAEDFVGSAGTLTGLTIALLNLDGDEFEHNTGIGSGCCGFNDPDLYLGPTPYDDGNGDNSINLAWLIGDLAAGNSVVIDYAYVFGDNIDDAGGDPDPNPVPEPGTLALLGAGLFGLGLARRRMKKA